MCRVDVKPYYTILYHIKAVSVGYLSVAGVTSTCSYGMVDHEMQCCLT